MFSWDKRKAARNFGKHSVSFEEAATVFVDPDTLEWEDTEHSDAEQRLKRLGLSVQGRAIILVYTMRRMDDGKKRFALSVRARQAAKSAKPIPDSQIDFSDIPESTDRELRRARRVGSPRTGNAKQLIAIRIAPRLLVHLRRLAAKQSKPYQTLIHELLERAAYKRVP